MLFHDILLKSQLSHVPSTLGATFYDSNPKGMGWFFCQIILKSSFFLEFSSFFWKSKIRIKIKSIFIRKIRIKLRAKMVAKNWSANVSKKVKVWTEQIHWQTFQSLYHDQKQTSGDDIFCKKDILKNSQNSNKSTWTGVIYSIKLQAGVLLLHNMDILYKLIYSIMYLEIIWMDLTN